MKPSTIKKECGRTFVVRVDGFAASAVPCLNPGNSSKMVFATTAAKWSGTNRRFQQVTAAKASGKGEVVGYGQAVIMSFPRPTLSAPQQREEKACQ